MTAPARTEDGDWNRWGADWRADRSVPPCRPDELRRAIGWGTLRLRLVAAIDLSWALASLGLSTVIFRQWDDLVMAIWVVAVWVFALATVALTFWNRRGLWLAREPTVAGFLDLQLRRSRAKLRTVVIVRAMILAQSAFLLPFGFVEYGAHPARYEGDPARALLRYVTIAALFLMAALWSVWFRRRAEAELAWCEPLARATGGVAKEEIIR